MEVNVKKADRINEKNVSRQKLNAHLKVVNFFTLLVIVIIVNLTSTSEIIPL